MAPVFAPRLQGRQIPKRAAVHMSKYDPIYNLLRDKSGPVEMSFAALAELLDGGLPTSAYRHGAWWSSDDDTHVQSRAWSAAGYHAEPDLADHTVRFVPR
jgi:hypothetical protein